MGREWELSFRLGMRPWIAVAYSAPVAAAMAVFLIYPIGQGSFSDGMPLGKYLPRRRCGTRSRPTPPDVATSGERRKPRCVACLNGETPHDLTTCGDIADNPVPNRNRPVAPGRQPGLYMIRCTRNDWRYYGESSNLGGRLASHRSLLNRTIHWNVGLQVDWSTYGPEAFEFTVLYSEPDWSKVYDRRGREIELIVADRHRAYNVIEGLHDRHGKKNGFWGRLHTPETKRKISLAMKGVTNDKLGRAISIDGTVYPSLAEASRRTSLARKTIRKRVNNPAEKAYFEVQPGSRTD